MTGNLESFDRFRANRSSTTTAPLTPGRAACGQLPGRCDKITDGWFLKGPIPGDWLATAAGLPGHALHVGLAVWHLTALTKKNQVVLSPKTLCKFATLPDAGRRGLKQLENAGLVAVERAPGKCARVTIITSK